MQLAAQCHGTRVQIGLWHGHLLGVGGGCHNSTEQHRARRASTVYIKRMSNLHGWMLAGSLAGHTGPKP